MAGKIYNLARMNTNTAGTGTLNLTSAVPPFLTFDQAGVQNNDQVIYSINDFTGGVVEEGLGTYSGSTLTRDTVYRSSGAGNTGKVSLSGQAEVCISLAKEFFGPLDEVHGGTGQTSYTTGDILYASSSTALAKLAGVATGNALISGGIGTAPSWGKIGLTTHVSGILGPANGGTGVANNAASTIAISGAFPLTLTLTGSTNVTLPTSGVLGNLTSTVPSVIGDIPVYTSTTGMAVSPMSVGVVFLSLRGVVCDGITAAAINDAAVAAAIAAAPTAGTDFVFPPGVCLVTALALSKPGIYRGTGMGGGGLGAPGSSTVIKGTTAGAHIISITAVNGGVKLQDLGVASTIAAGSRTGAGVRVNAGSNVLIERVYSQGHLYGFLNQSAGVEYKFAIASLNSSHGFLFDGTVNPQNEIGLYNARADSNSGDGFLVNGISTGIFGSRIVASGNTGAGFRAVETGTGRVGDVYLVMPEISVNGGNGIDFASNPNGSGLTISGGLIEGSSGTANVWVGTGFTLTTITGVEITDPLGTADNIFMNGKDATIAGNVMSNARGADIELGPTSSGIILTGNRNSNFGATSVIGLSIDGGAAAFTATGNDFTGATTVLVGTIPAGSKFIGNRGIADTVGVLAAPGTPAAGNAAMWFDSTDKRLHDKNDAGTIGTTVVAVTCTSQFISAISAAGVSTCSPLTAAEIPLTNTHILVGNVSNVAVDVALSGDATLANTGALTLATVNANVGTFGSATQSVQFTVNAKGLITAAANVTVTPAVGSITGFGTGVGAALAINIGSAGAPVLFNGAGGTPSSLTLTNATGLPLSTGVTGTLAAAQEPAHTGDVTNSAGSLAMTLASVITAGGPTGSATSIPVITYDAKGRLTAVTTATPTVTSVNGVAYPSSYTSGGVPYASGTGTIASSALLAANALVIGGGAGTAPATTATGTGVLTALAVNVGSAGAFVTFNGALGTPSTGVGTNITNVNAATLGGATFAAPGAIGGGTPGTGAFTSLTTTLDTGIGTASPASLNGRNRVLEVSAAAVSGTPGIVMRATASLSTNPAWEMYLNNPVGSETGWNLASGTTTIINARNSGNVTILGIIATSSTTEATSTTTGAITNPGGMSVNKHVWMNGLTTASAVLAGGSYLCQSSAGEVIADTVACLVSAARFKERFGGIQDKQALNMVLKMEPKSWQYKRQQDSVFPDEYYRERIGFVADDLAMIDPRLVAFGHDGLPRADDYDAVVTVQAGAIRALKAINDNLESRLQEIERKVA